MDCMVLPVTNVTLEVHRRRASAPPPPWPFCIGFKDALHGSAL